MTLTALVIAAGFAGSGLKSSGAAGGVEGSVGQSADGTAGPNRTVAIGDTGQEVGLTAAPERCRSAREAVSHYRLLTHEHQTARESPRLATRSPIVRGKSCRWARYAADEWQARARAARLSYERWLREHTLRDVVSWQAAIRIVQVVFPGTAAWMDSCSDAEGMSPSRDRQFYTYGYRPFSWAAWYADTVGGPGQIRPSTYRGMYASGLAYVLERGYRVARYLREADARSWQSMLAQAIAMGWARYTGNDNSHWSASWGRGC